MMTTFTVSDTLAITDCLADLIQYAVQGTAGKIHHGIIISERLLQSILINGSAQYHGWHFVPDLPDNCPDGFRAPIHTAAAGSVPRPSAHLPGWIASLTLLQVLSNITFCIDIINIGIRSCKFHRKYIVRFRIFQI